MPTWRHSLQMKGFCRENSAHADHHNDQLQIPYLSKDADKYLLSTGLLDRNDTEVTPSALCKKRLLSSSLRTIFRASTSTAESAPTALAWKVPPWNAQQRERVLRQYHQSNGNPTRGRIQELVWHHTLQARGQQLSRLRPRRAAIWPHPVLPLRPPSHPSPQLVRVPLSDLAAVDYLCQFQRSNSTVRDLPDVCLSTRPPLSFIPVTVNEPFSTWAINVVGPISTANINFHAKKYIITAVKYINWWFEAQAVLRHTGNVMRRFVREEIIGKFWAPKLLITDGTPSQLPTPSKSS